ncbi:MAG: adenylate cyclase, partial [Mesorhizobium sp.]
MTSALRLPPSPEEVRAELERILSSPEFSVPARACAFLRYVVEETLSGRATRLKGYSIAIEVFDRDENFTQDDPVVRIEAGRLRRALERYYLLSGCTDPIRIEIPKGGYVPVFSWNVANAVELTPVGPA